MKHKVPYLRKYVDDSYWLKFLTRSGRCVEMRLYFKLDTSCLRSTYHAEACRTGPSMTPKVCVGAAASEKTSVALRNLYIESSSCLAQPRYLSLSRNFLMFGLLSTAFTNLASLGYSSSPAQPF